MPAPVYITGTGLVTAQGLGVAENWKNLLAGRVLHETGIVPLPRDHALPRVSQLAIHAAREALAAAGLASLDDGRTALVIGTSKGPIEDWIDALDGRRPPDTTLGLARVAADLAAELRHANGPRLTLAGACASGLIALIRAADLIRQGVCDNALVVAAEASTHRLFQANFQRLGVLATNEDGCRPFDVRRRGFLLAEAAAAVCLTNRWKPVAVRLEHGIYLSDATHLTGIDPDGAALRTLLHELESPDIDLIHAHGTGTVINDAVELAALYATLTQYDPVVYSHKHAVGHTQGAAGLIGTVLNVEMHRRSFVLGNSNTETALPPGEKGHLEIRHDAAARPLDRSIVLAAGFGGSIAGVRLSSDPVAASDAER